MDGLVWSLTCGPMDLWAPALVTVSLVHRGITQNKSLAYTFFPSLQTEEGENSIWILS